MFSHIGSTLLQREGKLKPSLLTRQLEHSHSTMPTTSQRVPITTPRPTSSTTTATTSIPVETSTMMTTTVTTQESILNESRTTKVPKINRKCDYLILKGAWLRSVVGSIPSHVRNFSPRIVNKSTRRTQSDKWSSVSKASGELQFLLLSSIGVGSHLSTRMSLLSPSTVLKQESWDLVHIPHI